MICEGWDELVFEGWLVLLEGSDLFTTELWEKMLCAAH